MNTRIGAAAVATLLALGRPAWAADVFWYVGKSVSKAASEGKVARVAVLPFISTNGQHPEDGMVMADRLIGALVQQKKVRVVERELLQGVMKEHYLGTSGIVSPEGRRKIGQILSVDAIVTGSFVSFGRRAAMNARLIHVETGDILYAQTREIEIDWFDPIPIANPWGGLAGDFNYGPASCRDVQSQLDNLERALLEIKTRYWAIEPTGAERVPRWW